jgi:hypothetical protein
MPSSLSHLTGPEPGTDPNTDASRSRPLSAVFGGPLVSRTRGNRGASLPSLEQVEFSLDRRDALELHVERVLNFRKRSVKRLANLFDRRFDAVEPVIRLLDGRPIASC